ncbi:hypothetical protein DS2_17652 [Catenovulum agarivorans DS-2]|uniref:Peptidase A2 domain-containing protein n=1 Tax=Catenovulum agarivorans DS-2 TaxID=1328313 RepID=W7QSN2_9ALTE|nr:aspartyl protease family protein [Catenovulum agarivorans]EWH08390.1 hypothetical protein DS2_17652 [Catenovulum agarivorans DS-2]
MPLHVFKLLSLILAVCACSPQPATSYSSAKEATSTEHYFPEKHIPIYRAHQLPQTQQLGSLPIVKLIVNGQQGLFAFDTGATHAVISRAFLHKIAITDTGTYPVRDAANNIVQVGKLAALKVATEDATSFKILYPVAADIPYLNNLGLDGIVSPQSLISQNNACIHVDLLNNQAVVASLMSATCQLDNADYATFALSQAKIKQPLVQLTVLTGNKQHTEQLYLIDTGATTSSVSGRYAQHILSDHASQTVGLAGNVQSNKMAGPITFMLGKANRQLPQVNVYNREISILGMDVLNTAQIVIKTNGELEIKL